MERGLRGILIFLVGAVLLCANPFAQRAYGLAESVGPGGSNALAVHDPAGPNETGAGVKVGIIGTQNVYAGHEAFSGISVTNYWASGISIDPNWHDTMLAGILASGGGSGGYADEIGVAPAVELHSYRILYTSHITPGLAELVNTAGCRVIVSGYGLGNLEDADGQSKYSLAYDYYAYNDDVIFVNPAGKYNTGVNPPVLVTTVPGDAYNCITTGGLILNDTNDESDYRRVGTESCSGLTVDGRRKPDVAAPSGHQMVPVTWNGGVSGTWSSTTGVGGANGASSWAVPHTAGIAALLLGLADDSADAEDGHNEVVKAVIVNSAFVNVNDKADGWTDPADSNNTFHIDRGFGRVDAKRAYDTLSQSQIEKDVTTMQQSGWAYESMGRNQVHSYFITGQSEQRLIFTACWNRAATKVGSNFGDEGLPRFNIDVSIKDPQGVEVFAESDTLNNLVKADILLPEDGVYEVVLDNTVNKTRDYGVAFELVSPIVGDFSPIDYVVDPLDMEVLAREWLSTIGGQEADLTGEGVVDFNDLAEFGCQWGQFNPYYYPWP